MSRTHRAAAAVPYINRAAARRMAAAEPDFKTDLPGVGRDLRHPGYARAGILIMQAGTAFERLALAS